MTEPNEKVADLIDRLLANTREGKVLWSESDSETTYVATVAGASISVDRPGERTLFAVRNDRGRLLEEVFATPNEVWEDNLVQIRINGTLPTLYDVVRRTVLDIDSAIDSILDQL